MRLLADENFPKSIVEELRANGHDVVWARTHHPGATDAALLNLAEADERILFTLDRDFLQIAFQRRMPPGRCGVVLFRIHPAIPTEIGRYVKACLDSGRELAGYVSIVGRDGIHQVQMKRI
jgi:predicted nuclease of predicted toxin-antitoxin system